MEQTTDYSRYKTLFSILAIALLVWGALGAREVTRTPYAGYRLSSDNVITQVREGSPAAIAGLKAGDQVTKIDNVPVGSVAGFYERGRPAIGSTGSVTVKRGGTEQTITFKYAERPMGDLLVASIGLLTGLAFLIFGMLAYLKNPTRLSTTLCALSLMLALLFLQGPYISSAALRRGINAVISVVVGIMLATLLDYCLSYPRVKEVLASRPWLRQAIFGIAPLMGLIVGLINLAAPNISATNSLLLGVAIGVIYGGYVLLAVVAVIHSYVKAGAEERSASGLNLMLAGMVIGFGPLIVSILAHTILPHIGDLPGERFWPITSLAIPISLALALMKLEPAPGAAKTGEEATA